MADRGEGETRADVARRLGVPTPTRPTVVQRDDPDWGWTEDDPERRRASDDRE